MSLPEFAVKRPVATLMLLVSLLVLGAVAIPRLPLAFMPTVEAPFVRVVVPYPGSHPLENLRQIVLPLEEELATIPGVKRIGSDADVGQASLRIRFDWSVDLDLKKMEVREGVERVRPDLPAGIGRIRVVTFHDGPANGAIMQGRISAERDLSESYELLDRKIRRPLERIRGVANVELDGVQPQEVRVEIDPDALVRHSLDAGDLIERLQQANLDLDLGAIRGDVLRYDVRSLGRFRRLEEVRDLRLGEGDLRVRDVANVELKEPPLEYGRHLDREFAIGIDVFKEPTANTVETSERLMARIAEFDDDPELEGITVLVWLNSGDEIKKSLAGLRNAGLFGGFLAVAVLFVFLRRLSTTLIVAVAIPFSLVVACGIMYVLGTVLNVLAMLGLMVGVGMLVDNAVVVVENIYRLQGLGMSPREAAKVGAREVSLAVLAATATSVIVWSWLFTIESGHPMRIYIGAVALSISLAVMCSLLVSLTLIPLAAARFVPKKEIRPGFVLTRIVPRYQGLLSWTLRHRGTTLFVLLLLAGSAAIPIARIEKSGDPKEQQREVTVHYQVRDSVNLEKMEEYVNVVEDWMEENKEHLGYESLYSWYDQRGFGVTRAYLPWERVNEAEIALLREKMDGHLPVIPGVKLEIGDRNSFRRGNNERRMVTVAITGEDPEYLRDVALDVERRIKSLDHVKNIFGPTLNGRQEARILVDPERAHALDITPQHVAQVVGFTYRGRQLRRFEGPHGEVEMLVGLPEGAQPGVAALDRLVIPREGAESVPLGAVAEVFLTRTDEEIERENRKTTQWVTVEFDADQVETTEAGRAMVAKNMNGLELPEGYVWDWTAERRDDDEALGIMFMGILLALALVIILMAALFESLLQALAVLITLPLAFFGAFWALWLLGFQLEVVAFMGVIILIGMVVNNGIVMVDHVNSLRRAGLERTDALVRGCGDRLRPVFMTTITTLFGLGPLAFSGFTVAGIYVDSMAVAILGGLASSTIFTLVALPVWYSLLEDFWSVAMKALPGRAPRTEPRRAPGVLAGTR